MAPTWLQELATLPYLLLQNIRPSSSDTSTQTQLHKQRQAALPRALPPNRSQIPLTYNPTKNTTSPLLTTLPLELRRKIYTHALASHTIHILLHPGKLTHTICTIPYPPDFSRACHPPSRHRLVSTSTPLPPPSSSPRIAVPLLRTCHQIYTEALPLLYANNTFDIDDLGAFNLLASTIPPHALASITSLHLKWITDYPPLESDVTAPAIKAPYDDATYLLFWRTVATAMPALKELRLGIQDVWWVRELQIGDAWVGPVKRVRGLEVFEVKVVEVVKERDLIQVERFARELRTLVCRAREGEDGRGPG